MKGKYQAKKPKKLQKGRSVDVTKTEIGNKNIEQTKGFY